MVLWAGKENVQIPGNNLYFYLSHVSISGRLKFRGDFQTDDDDVTHGNAIQLSSWHGSPVEISNPIAINGQRNSYDFLAPLKLSIAILPFISLLLNLWSVFWSAAAK